jgi:putative DNA primase/helicase
MNEKPSFNEYTIYEDEPKANGATAANEREREQQIEPRGWPDPKPLPIGLAPVNEFSSDFLPENLGPWINDIADRLQCPPDYAAVTAIVALGSVIGRRLGIKPQMKTDWIEVPNLWGGFIGRPGMLKSPAMSEALKPIHRLESEASKDYEIARKAYANGRDVYCLRKQVATSQAKDKLKNDPAASIDFGLGDEPEEPLRVRYCTNDSTYEGLGELLIANPSGILVERDELISLLTHLDRDDQAVARGFYLSGSSGTQPYTFDRVGRGQRHIEAICISVLGNTQPARVTEYVRRANAGGAGGDGMIQRFSLMVWPDAPSAWEHVDEYPNRDAREMAWKVFGRASKIDTEVALKMGAIRGDFDRVPWLRFDEAAYADFLDWRKDLEQRLRSGDMSPALEGHLSKYRKLVPALALINHIADYKDGQGAVSHEALSKALKFAKYLESHAKRVYRSSAEREVAAAKAILARILKGDLSDGFTARDIYQRDWSNLSDREAVQAGLDLLLDLDYIAASTPITSPVGGRPKVTYTINPKGLSK